MNGYDDDNEHRGKSDTILMEFGVSEDYKEVTFFISCGEPLKTEEIAGAMRKFADAYESGEIVATPLSGAEESGTIQ